MFFFKHLTFDIYQLDLCHSVGQQFAEVKLTTLQTKLFRPLSGQQRKKKNFQIRAKCLQKIYHDRFLSQSAPASLSCTQLEMTGWFSKYILKVKLNCKSSALSIHLYCKSISKACIYFQNYLKPGIFHKLKFKHSVFIIIQVEQKESLFRNRPDSHI